MHKIYYYTILIFKVVGPTDLGAVGDIVILYHYDGKIIDRDMNEVDVTGLEKMSKRHIMGIKCGCAHVGITFKEEYGAWMCQYCHETFDLDLHCTQPERVKCSIQHVHRRLSEISKEHQDKMVARRIRGNKR